MEQFKIRCSAISHIMATSGIKEGTLSKGSQTYCKDWLKGQLFNRKKIMWNKFTQKGHEVEQDALDFVAKQMRFGAIIKNETHHEDDDIMGTPDAVLRACTLDVKSSWSWEMFPYLEESLPGDNYYWQGQGYMVLTGKPIHQVCYVLQDTPMHLIEREARRYCWDNGYGDLSQNSDILEHFVKQMTYGDIPDDMKIKIFSFERNDDEIKMIRERVKMCREFLKKLLPYAYK